MPTDPCKHLDPGILVRVEFLDHCAASDTDELMKCVAYGRVHEIDAEKLVIDTWHPKEGTLLDPRDVPGNTENFCLIRSAITGVTQLYEVRMGSEGPDNRTIGLPPISDAELMHKEAPYVPDTGLTRT